MVLLIRQYYTGKTTQVKSEGTLSDEFGSETRLEQGCCLAPLLFNIYVGAVFGSWVKTDGAVVQCFTHVDGVLRKSNYCLNTPRINHYFWRYVRYANKLATAAETSSALKDLALHVQRLLQNMGFADVSWKKASHEYRQIYQAPTKC